MYVHKRWVLHQDRELRRYGCVADPRPRPVGPPARSQKPAERRGRAPDARSCTIVLRRVHVRMLQCVKTTAWGRIDVDNGPEESDGEEDPEQALRKEVDDKHAFLEGARCIVEARETARELQPARMRLEDNDARETARERERARTRLEDLSGLR